MDKETQNKLYAQVRENYNSIAPDFSASRQRPLWKEVVDVARQVAPGERVLDIGCGNGRLIEHLPARADYLGVDISEEMVNIAKKRYPNHNFRVLDALDISEIEGEFDHIFAIAFLHHIPGKTLRELVLRQMKDKLMDKGEMFITVWNIWSRLKLRRLAVGFAAKKVIGVNRMDFGDILFSWGGSSAKDKKRYYHGFTGSGLKRLSRATGLGIKYIKKDKNNYYLKLKKETQIEK